MCLCMGKKAIECVREKERDSKRVHANECVCVCVRERERERERETAYGVATMSRSD